MSKNETGRGAPPPGDGDTTFEGAVGMVAVGGGIILLSFILDPDVSSSLPPIGIFCFVVGAGLVWLMQRKLSR